MKKYEFTGETIQLYGLTLKRIKRLSDGLVGGWIEKEENLSHDGECFVYDEAKVFGNAVVDGNAQVSSTARVFSNAVVSGNADVYGNVTVSGGAVVSGEASVYGNAMVGGNARIYGNTKVFGNAIVTGNTNVYGKANVYDNTLVTGDAKVFGDAKVRGAAKVFDDAEATSLVYNVILDRHSITMTDNHIAIGCENRTFAHWKEHIKEIGKNNNYSDKQIKAIRNILNGLLALKQENKRG